MKRFVVTVLAACLVGGACARETPDEPEGARRTKAELHRLTRARVEAGMLARTDGYVYAVDVALLMIFAAGESDEVMYATLRDFALEHLVVDDGDDPYTRGFVLWRYCDGVAPDASGTTEALRIAEGLWRGSKAFGFDADRETALLVLDGYARHAAEEQGVWMIRNYFNLGTRSFANNSYLVDYAPISSPKLPRRQDGKILPTSPRARTRSSRAPARRAGFSTRWCSPR